MPSVLSIFFLQKSIFFAQKGRFGPQFFIWMQVDSARFHNGISNMGRRTSTTNLVVQTVHLYGLSEEQTKACDSLAREAGRCWTDLVNAHKENRKANVWLTDGELKAMFKGGQYALHANSVQALIEKLIGNVKTAKILRQQQAESGVEEEKMTKYPYLPKDFQNVIWKGGSRPSFKVNERKITLSNGRGRVGRRVVDSL
jgi:hypothetical protein